MWGNIERNRQTDAFAERLEIRIHAVAIVVTATVLAMRLIAGTQDLTSDTASWQDELSEQRGPSSIGSPARAPAHPDK